MSESLIASSAKSASDAAALSLIDIRRIDRAAGKGAKRGDLTHKLKRQANNEVPPARASVAPVVAPIATPLPVAAVPESPPLAAFAPQPEPAPIAAPSIAPAPEAPPLAAFAPEPEPLPFAAPPTAPAPESPPLAAFAREDASPPVTRYAAALPEPYVAPSDELAPSYIVGVPAALPSLQAAPPAPVSDSAPLPYDDLRSADDLVYYWDELRGGRELPLFSNLDRTRIAISWPDTVMVNYDLDRAAVPQIARLSRLTGVVEFTSMVTEWILSCSRQVARIGKAMETKRAFDGAHSARSYHMLLLPFATSGGTSDHVLCHLSCAD
jgi:hypothetical protein